MKILYLGPDSSLVTFLGNVRRTEEQIEDFGDADFVISYGYRHIIRNTAELRRMDGRAINLHISYLPWNRGADPNFWSWIDDTPKGVTIHYLDAGIDTGDIIVQEKVVLNPSSTLRSSYNDLHKAMIVMFKDYWPLIRRGSLGRHRQNGKGTYHKTADKEAYWSRLQKGWDTPISDVLTIS